MRLLALFACSALALLEGCILVYDPGDFQIADGGSGGPGGGPACSPQDQLGGAPVMASEGQWTWVPVPEAKCRNGSPTGFGVRIKSKSTKLFIFFDGVGACVNTSSCMATASSFDNTSFSTWQSASGNAGILDTSNTANPVRDWNAVYIPYCTGDVHAGSNTADVPNDAMLKNQSFFGYANVGHYMARIVPTFPGLTEALVVGTDGGGFGALVNYDRIARDLCPVPVVMIDDSAPLMSDTYVAPCLQTRLRTLWGLNAAVSAYCPEAIGANGGGSVNVITCLGTKYAAGRLGIVASTKDSNVAAFYGLGENGCANIDGSASPLPTYAAGLGELRSAYMKSPAWGSYFVDSTSHTYLGGGSFYTTTVTGVSLTSWVSDMVNGGAIGDVGP